MPFILNGEVLKDDDPRAIARRQQTQQAQPRRGLANINGLNSQGGGGGATAAAGGRPMGGRTGAPEAQQPAQPQHPDGVLAPVARALGVEGKTLAIPMQLTQVIGMQGQQTLPYVHALLIAGFGMYMLFFRGNSSGGVSGTRQAEFTGAP